MPGKYDPEQFAKHAFERRKPTPRIIYTPEQFLTDEEWWETEHYKKLKAMALRNNKKK